MADQEQVRRLKEEGVDAWNEWRRWGNCRQPDLKGADFIEANLHGANLSGADLSSAYLCGANLSLANLRAADLTSAYLHGADLGGADLSKTDLSAADLVEAHLHGADLSWADLTEAKIHGANLESTIFRETVLANLDLSGCKNLERCTHAGPSIFDMRTLQRSGPLPLTFLRGVGLPDTLLEYLPSLLNQAIQHHSCFISYSSQDDDFARRLYADLQNNGVRCWFAPHDLPIGAKTRDTIDEAIRLRDKVLIVLSAAAIASDWVEDEVDKAFEEERSRGGVVLFPVRLDDSVLETNKSWAAKLRRNRNISDFCRWKDHDAYQSMLERLLRDLRVQAASPTAGAPPEGPPA